MRRKCLDRTEAPSVFGMPADSRSSDDSQSRCIISSRSRCSSVRRSPELCRLDSQRWQGDIFVWWLHTTPRLSREISHVPKRRVGPADLWQTQNQFVGSRQQTFTTHLHLLRCLRLWSRFFTYWLLDGENKVRR